MRAIVLLVLLTSFSALAQSPTSVVDGAVQTDTDAAARRNIVTLSPLPTAATLMLNGFAAQVGFASPLTERFDLVGDVMLFSRRSTWDRLPATQFDGLLISVGAAYRRPLGAKLTWFAGPKLVGGMLASRPVTSGFMSSMDAPERLLHVGVDVGLDYRIGWFNLGTSLGATVGYFEGGGGIVVPIGATGQIAMGAREGAFGPSFMLNLNLLRMGVAF